MVEILTASLQQRRIPHRRNCCRRAAGVDMQRGYTANRVVANTVTFLWILITLISFLSFREEAFVCANDDAVQADDGNVNNNNDDAAAAANGDDAAEASNDDAAAAAETNDDASSNNAYENEQKQYQDTDDDTFHWNQNIGFDGVSVMPLSCIN